MDDKLDIYNFLSQFQNEDIIYVPNPGNAGDSLIAHATYKVLDNIGLSYSEGSLDKVYPGRCVIYGGGGNLVEPYQNARRFLQNNHSKVSTLIILPHTVRSYPDLLNQFDNRVHVICREIKSLDYAKKNTVKANVHHSDDMVFNLDVENLLEDGKSDFLSIFSQKSLLIRNTKRVTRKSLFNIKNKFDFSHLNAFRGDVEKTDIAVPFNNIDISQTFATDDMSKMLSYEASYRMIDFIHGYNEVHTNRLHVCIAATLLGKKVCFYPNSYDKNFSVFNYSINNTFKNVEFMNNK